MNPNNKWHPKHEEICRKMAENGSTGTEIALRIGKSRSAVLGFISRKRIKLHGKPHGIRKKITIVDEIDNITTLQQPVKKPPVGYSKWGGSQVSLSPRIAPPNAPTPRFMDSCQYLAGCPRERQFCGQPVRKGSPYCGTHHLLCFQH